MTKTIGYWKLEKNDENFDEYLKAVGVGILIRQAVKRLTTYENIRKIGDDWSLDITSTFKDVHLRFKLGEEFDETTGDGRQMKSVFNLEDKRLVHFQKATVVGGVDSVVTRECIDDDTMLVTLDAIGKNVRTVRTFKRHLQGFIAKQLAEYTEKQGIRESGVLVVPFIKDYADGADASTKQYTDGMAAHMLSVLPIPIRQETV